MHEPLDIDDIRRRAPLHFLAKADNARYCAWSLWTLLQADRFPDVDEADYGGSPQIALGEGWRRERSLALECIVKAVIAQREEGSKNPKVVRASHNVSHLWGEAKLPKVDKDDRIRLVITWQLLQWSGRYAAPIEGSDGQRQDLAQLTKQQGTLLTRRPPFGWLEFDRLYQTALIAFWKTRAAIFPDVITNEDFS